MNLPDAVFTDISTLKSRENRPTLCSGSCLKEKTGDLTALSVHLLEDEAFSKAGDLAALTDFNGYRPLLLWDFLRDLPPRRQR
jgi:hypothetical protein